MLTEQEAVASLRERVSKGIVKQETKKYLDKITIVEKMLLSHQVEIKELTDKLRSLEGEIFRVKGAISILIELAAESEGMVDTNGSNKQ